MVDLVSDVLAVSGVRGAIGARIEAGGAWATRVEDDAHVSLHAVTDGRATLTVAGDRPRELAEGDVVLLPVGVPHVLSSAPGLRAGPLDRRAFTHTEAVTLGTPPVHTRIVTMHYTCDRRSRTQVLESLPDLIHIGPGQSTPGLAGTVRLIGHELAHPQLAASAVLNSLVDVTLIQLVRAWLPTRPAGQRVGWLNALDDPIVLRAVHHIHARPALPWTIASLAAAAKVSRATLCRRFAATIGLAPAAYLTQWRLDLAARRLRTTRDPVAAIAAAVGYGTVPAFSRAFTRSHGQTPAHYRSRFRGSTAVGLDATALR
ncbi:MULTISPECIES: AraC family transcriptional regulator [Catenuloplanes]|uniref:AraC-like DNA-binding protein n=1 Tax=Catenuloplanes niger TaxID=587534 RepID=A0AAE4CVP1_9ACTN|nr:AraC family transcriptional regulator [Catenuloplanes niger]MDR7327596.1 AraC-like DNA-binding protein [Catenuloplanes niger]